MAGRKTQSAIFANDFTFQRQSCWKAHASKRRKVEKNKKEKERERCSESRDHEKNADRKQRNFETRLVFVSEVRVAASKGCRPSVKRSNAPVKKALTYGAFSTGRGRSGRDRREKEKSFFQESEVTFRSAFENGDFLEMSMPRTREICLS